jgi:hypothetical protein
MLSFVIGIIVGVGGALIFAKINDSSNDGSLIELSQTEKEKNLLTLCGES